MLFFVYVWPLTLGTEFSRVKMADQLLKFSLIYPAFYCVGRSFGIRYSQQPAPVNYYLIAALIAAEIAVQQLALPYLYKELDFQFGALHGTFKERTWLAVFFFLLSYWMLENIHPEERDRSSIAVLAFVIVNALIAIFSGSKTTLVACGIVLLARVRMPFRSKAALGVLGALLYFGLFANEFSDEHLRIRIEQERGRALEEGMALVADNPLGYGLGFVESYFSTLPLKIMGLGEGTNSVFSAPLDLAIVAGPAGLVLWLVFFFGLGIRCVGMLAPVAALSLLNPLHQSEFVYFFLGMLVSVNRRNRAVAISGRPNSASRQSDSHFVKTMTSGY
jgi:hypothetical protein